ncbi:MAG: hypothetical protein E6K70_06225, partial [Planctomycetota bacterium]
MRGIYLAVAFFPGVSLAGPAAPAAETVNYVRDIKPLLSTRCYACHGALRQKSNLRLDTAALIRKGGRHGPAIVPGQGVQSLLIAAVTGNNRPRMPPASEGAPLTEKQVGLAQGVDRSCLGAQSDRGGAWRYLRRRNQHSLSHGIDVDRRWPAKDSAVGSGDSG